MKKTYITPTMTVVKETWSLLTASQGQPTVTISRDGSVDAGSVESRRGFSFWDDDEEE